MLKKAECDAEGFSRAVTEELRRLPRVSGSGAGEAYPSASLRRLLSEAEKLASAMKDEYVSAEHLFLCLFDNTERGLDKVFTRFGVTKEKFLQGLKAVRGTQNVTSDNPEGTYEALEKYGTDLTKRASEHKLEPVIGRDEEIRNVIRILSRKTKNNREYIEKDAALERRFQPVLVGEPTVEDTVSILRGLKERFEIFHGVRIHDDALIAAATLSNRYISDRFLPDKAIDLVDEAAAMIRTEIDSMPSELDSLNRKIIQLEVEENALSKEKDNLSTARLETLKA